MNKYIPSDYEIKYFDLFTLVFSKNEKQQFIQELSRTIANSFKLLTDKMQININHHITYIVFNSMDDFEKITKKVVSDTSFMVLYQSFSKSYICFFSPMANEININQERIQRHLIHELMHIWIGLQTGSVREINKSNSSLYVPVWLDEGVSEYISLKLTGNENKLKDCRERYVENKLEEYVINKKFDFYGNNCHLHYQIVTGLVCDLVDKFGNIDNLIDQEKII